jgi:hypothetical protein
VAVLSYAGSGAPGDLRETGRAALRFCNGEAAIRQGQDFEKQNGGTKGFRRL